MQKTKATKNNTKAKIAWLNIATQVVEFFNKGENPNKVYGEHGWIPAH